MPTFRARHLPADDDQCGWLETVPRLPAAPPLEGELRVDAAVIGAGFTGLAAARRLATARPEWTIALVEAQRVGEGASGRSSGFVVDLAGFIADMPPDDAERYIRLSRAGIADLRHAVETGEIACDWDDRGWLHVAAGAPGELSLLGLRAWLEGRRERLEWLDAEAMAALTGSTFYRAGLRLPGSVLVQAGSLVRGLARTLPDNVRIYEQSPVVRVVTGPPHQIVTGGGRLRADRLVVALNAYLPNLGMLPRRIFPLLTYGSLSRPLTDDEQASLGGERTWGLLAQDPMGSSVRRTADQRLLIRNTVHYDPAIRSPARLRARMREIHRRALVARFPGFRDLELPYTWGGAMGLSGNQKLFFGALGEAIVGVAGFRGAGIAMGTVCGRLAAERLLGEGSALLDDVEALPGPCWIPPQPYLGIGIRWRVGQMNRSAGRTL